MIWTKDKLAAARLLGLDPENPRHRNLLEKCISDAEVPLPVRGRPKGTGKYSDEALSAMAYLIDLLEAIHSHRLGQLSDEELLSHGLWGVGGRIIRCNGSESELKQWGLSDHTMENTMVLLPAGEVKSLAIRLAQEDEKSETPLEMVTRIIPHLNPRMVWRWPVTSGVPTGACHWVEPGTFRNLLARGRQIRRASGAPGVPQPGKDHLHE
jgi:hypothetical protein